MDIKTLNEKRTIRKLRTRKKIGRGTAERPRLSVFRSSRHIYAQLIDDDGGKTIASVSSEDMVNKKTNKTDKALEVGKLIAMKAKKLKIDKIIFDKGQYSYHGRVEAVASGARKGGLQF